MRLGRPRTLLGLILLGLALVALPLLIAIGTAVVTLGRHAAESEAVVNESAIITRENQRIATLLGDMERNARQVPVLRDPALLGVYESDLAALGRSIAAIVGLPPGADVAPRLAAIERAAGDVHRALEEGLDEAGLERVLESFRVMNTDAREAAQMTRARLNEKLAALQESSEAARQSLVWQSAALVPGTLVLILFFLLLVGRPMRRVDRAIRALGEGDFNQAIEVTGPRDIEALGRKLEWLRLRLMESAEEKNKFLRHMSHELKTPLANIREGTELLMDGSVGRLDHQQQEVTSILRDNGVKLQQLIENLLTFSAWQAKTAKLEITEFELKPLVFSVMSQHRLVISRQQIRLKLNLEPIRVRADEGKLRLVLENLVSNAIKFAPRGGTISVDAVIDGPELVIDVRDDGPGVAPEDGDRIFEAFYQGRRLQGGTVGGTGIGLSVVAECVQAHGGTVRLVRETRSGAHFQVRLPLRRTHDRPLMVASA
jgi:two-component system, NtrC family, sensor histidine kinase GlrK